MSEQEGFDKLMERNPHLRGVGPVMASDTLRQIWSLAWRYGRREGQTEGRRAAKQEAARRAKQPGGDFLDGLRKLGIKL